VNAEFSRTLPTSDEQYVKMNLLSALGSLPAKSNKISAALASSMPNEGGWALSLCPYFLIWIHVEGREAIYTQQASNDLPIAK
jgi:hypothetical protein